MTEYTVALEPGASPSVESFVRSEAVGDTRRFSIGEKVIIVGEFEQGVAAELAQEDDVAYVEDNAEDIGPLTVDPEPREVVGQAETLPWGIDRVDADEVSAAGSGVDVAVVDTGIDPGHEDLEANLGAGHAVVQCEGSDCEERWDDDHSHGTHVAGTIGAVASDVGVVGVAPAVTLHAVKVLSASGSGTFAGVAEGVVTAADEGYQVINMSLGAPTGRQVVKDAVAHAAEQGVTIVCAAGNDGPCQDCVGFPAAYEECIAVSATNSNDEMAGFTSQGPQVEVAGPGVDVLSTLPENSYGEFSGTSMASPHVAGGAALLVASGLDRSSVRDQLKSTAEDLGHGNNLQGSGLLDVQAAVSDEPPEEPPENPTASVQLLLTQKEPERGNIEVEVLDSAGDTPLEDALVTVEGPELTDEKQTNSDGMATWTDVPITEYFVAAQKQGYNRKTTEIAPGDFD